MWVIVMEKYGAKKILILVGWMMRMGGMMGWVGGSYWVLVWGGLIEGLGDGG